MATLEKITWDAAGDAEKLLADLNLSPTENLIVPILFQAMMRAARQVPFQGSVEQRNRVLGAAAAIILKMTETVREQIPTEARHES